jgi:hypothetical protein
MFWAVPDVINGCLEFIAIGFILASCVKLHRDKQVRGVSLVHITFYVSWAYWNLYFYPSVGAWLSFYGGIGVVIVNTVWLGMMVYYLRKEKNADTN